MADSLDKVDLITTIIILVHDDFFFKFKDCLKSNANTYALWHLRNFPLIIIVSFS